MDGVLNVHKPSGPTSHDIVDQARRIFGQRRIGHAGTLDPLASGVLVVCLGKATRIVEYLMGAPKGYRARMALGVTTDSQDSTGAVTDERDASGVTLADIKATVEAFVGEIEQIPPMVSALKHEGKRLYKLAREGKTVERAPRRVTIYSIDVTDVPDDPSQFELFVRCSSGTYIRTLCADIGEKLGCGAHMSMLERTSVGRFGLKDAVSIEGLLDAQSRGELDRHVMGVNDALSDIPALALGAKAADRVLHGLPAECAERFDDGATIRILFPSGGLVALGLVEYTPEGIRVKPKKVFADAIIPECTGEG